MLKRNTVNFSFLFIFIAGGVFLLGSDQAEAIEVTRRIFIDEPTISRGYTITADQGNFLIGIRPFVFSEACWVKTQIHSPLEVNQPDNLRLISSIYTYDIRMSEPQVLDEPIIIALKYQTVTDSPKSIYFYNRVVSSWQAIPTTFDSDNNYARAFIHFPFSQVAVFEDNDYGQIGPIDSESALTVDLSDDQIIYSKNINQLRPIASITKLMTALVWLDQEIDWDDQYIISADYSYLNTTGAKLYVREGESLYIKDLFFSMLVGSANNAALALADSTGLSQSQFIVLMNDKAASLGMTDTTFTDPSGLDVTNISTAWDIFKLSKEAFRFFEILQGTTSRSYSFNTINTNQPHIIKTTNELNNSDLYLTGSKTGYLDEAGYCLVVKAKNSQNQEVISLVLGNSSWQDRFDEVEELVYYTYNEI